MTTVTEPVFTKMTEEMVVHLRPDSFKIHPLTDALEFRDLGFGELSGGAVTMGVYRSSPKGGSLGWHTHDLEFHLGYVLKGWAEFEFEGVGKVRLEAGTAIYQLPWNKHRELEQSDDFEVLEITLPADYETTGYRFDKAIGTHVPVAVEPAS